jgi:hypothetical protein
VQIQGLEPGRSKPLTDVAAKIKPKEIESKKIEPEKSHP